MQPRVYSDNWQGWYRRRLPCLLNLGEICQAVRGQQHGGFWANLSPAAKHGATLSNWKPKLLLKKDKTENRQNYPLQVCIGAQIRAWLARLLGSLWEFAFTNSHEQSFLRFSERFRGCRFVEPCEGVRSWFSSDSAAVCFSHVYRFMLPQTLLHTQIHTAHTARPVKSMTPQRYICTAV